jgi:hypothetical protein
MFLKQTPMYKKLEVAVQCMVIFIGKNKTTYLV